MTFTQSRPTYSDNFIAIPAVVNSAQGLTVDDQLGLMWVIYKNMGGLVTPAAPGASERIKLVGSFVYEVANLSHKEQLQFMRDLVAGVNNDQTRAYAGLSSNNKLGFWFQLAEWISSGDVVPTPAGYQLSAPASAVLNDIVALDFNQQIAVLRLLVGQMGPASLTV